MCQMIALFVKEENKPHSPVRPSVAPEQPWTTHSEGDPLVVNKHHEKNLLWGGCRKLDVRRDGLLIKMKVLKQTL